jgi:hypothetical protein
VPAFQAATQPVISVDAKQKEHRGNCKNPGQEDAPPGKAPQGRVDEFLDPAPGQALPYGVSDLTEAQGWGSVGLRAETAAFAVATSRTWWQQRGKPLYKQATELEISAEGGGSNGSRGRLGKTERPRLAHDLHLTLHVSHFPPGTSKWNKLAQRLFSFLSKNWRGRPLLDGVTVVNLSGNTKTKTGLTLQARLADRRYEKGRKVSEQEMQLLTISRDPFQGEWNYSLAPQGMRIKKVINA